MSPVVSEEPHLDFAEIETVPISFLVETQLTPVMPSQGRSGMVFAEQTVDPPYTKDYDRPGSRPRDWAESWDLSNWGFLTVREAEALVGVAAIAWSTPGVDLLEGRVDVSVLWDLRIAPACRRRGLGKALFDAAVEWSQRRHVSVMKIETQSVNVPACRFYARQGCQLAGIDSRAYPELPHEVQLMWTLKL